MSKIPEEDILKVHDGCDYKCVYCDYDGKNRDDFRFLAIDHVLPKHYGGSDDMDNLVTACLICNRYKNRYNFKSRAQARLWLKLYKEICTNAYYQAHVVERKNPRIWNPSKKLDEVWKLFEERGGDPRATKQAGQKRMCCVPAQMIAR
jgi:hypothetical protein